MEDVKKNEDQRPGQELSAPRSGPAQKNWAGSWARKLGVAVVATEAAAGAEELEEALVLGCANCVLT